MRYRPLRQNATVSQKPFVTVAEVHCFFSYLPNFSKIFLGQEPLLHCAHDIVNSVLESSFCSSTIPFHSDDAHTRIKSNFRNDAVLFFLFDPKSTIPEKQCSTPLPCEFTCSHAPMPRYKKPNAVPLLDLDAHKLPTAVHRSASDNRTWMLPKLKINHWILAECRGRHG